MPNPDPIDRLFDQAVKDGRREAVCTHWPDVVRLEVVLLEVGGPDQNMIVQVDTALCDIEVHPEVADLSPREYERLHNALTGLKAALTEFQSVWGIVEAQIARWQEEESST
ncbi:MAG: hypothetical protein ACYC6N_18785 [Pirellulaceae bacterium]